uniref:Plac8 onzin related protein 6 n=1 Tax=Anabas testudineus TaxID=64144 RepID=A0A3Q1J0D5_ANATE
MALLSFSICGQLQQLMATQPMTNWSTGLLDCCESMSTCCYGFWCCPCLACTVSASFGENRCLPLCDMLSPAITSALGIPLCVPPAVLSMRVAIRHRYGIKGSLCKDIATSCFCEWCSWCQMHRELKYRNVDTEHVPLLANLFSPVKEI